MLRLTSAVALGLMLVTPALAQDTTTPVITAPETQSDLQTKKPATTSGCMRDKHVMS